MIKINKGLFKEELENYAKKANTMLAEKINLIDCSLGTNPFGLSKKISKHLDEFNIEEISLYPKDNDNLKSIIAANWENIAKIEISQIQFGHGGMGVCELINKILLNEKSNVLGYCPQFADYILDVEKCSANYNCVPLKEENNYKFDVEEFVKEINMEYDVIYIDNPNNPTGQIIDINKVEKIVKKANELDIAVIIDESYGDYMDDNNSAISLVSRYDNIFVVRSFSKAYGMAGLRVGYAVMSKALVNYFEKVVIAFPINIFGQHFIKYVYEDKEFLIDCFSKIKKSKEKIIKKVNKLKIIETDVRVPIMTIIHPDKNIDLYELFLKEGILTNSCKTYINLDKNSVRMRISSEIETILIALENIEKN